MDEGAAASEDLFATARSAALDGLAVATITALAKRGVESLLLRGPVIARRLYDSSIERPYSDVDLLVDPAAFAAAEAVLVELGLHEAPLEAAFPDSRPQHAHTWTTQDGRAVDLHRGLIGAGAPSGEVWRILRSSAVTFSLEGADVLVPSDHALAVSIALHAAHHVDRSPQPLADLERALERLPADVWAAAAELAGRTGSGEAFAAGLRLTDAGRTLAARWPHLPSLSAPPSAMGRRSFHVAQGLTWLWSTEGIGAKAKFLRERLAPSPRAMRTRSRLARRGALGLLLAYVLRWTDAVRELPAAVRGLRRARR